MPLDYKDIIKKIASKVSPVDVGSKMVQGDVLSRFENPLDKAKASAAQIGTDLAYTALTKKKVQDVEAKEVGREMAKNMGYGETGQMLAGALAQYGPSVLGMVRPVPKQAADQVRTVTKLVRAPSVSSNDVGKVILKQEPIKKSLGIITHTLGDIKAEQPDIMRRAAKTASTNVKAFRQETTSNQIMKNLAEEAIKKSKANKSK